MDITVERIFALLSEHGIEQKEFAKAIGATVQHISEWKSGKTKTYTKFLKEICLFFDVSADYLIGITDIRDHAQQVDIKSVIFGHDAGITVEMVEDVLKYAKMVELYETVNRAKKSGGVTAIAIEPYDSIHDPRIERIRNELRKIQMDVDVISDVDIEEIKSQKKPVETK